MFFCLAYTCTITHQREAQKQVAIVTFYFFIIFLFWDEENISKKAHSVYPTQCALIWF